MDMNNFLLQLYQLGKDLPQCLVELSEIAHPGIPSEQRIPYLCKLFEKLETDAKPELDSTSFKLLTELRELTLLIQKISYLQIFQLSNYLSRTEEKDRANFLLRLQKLLRTWGKEKLEHYHIEIRNTPLYLETKTMAELEPELAGEMISVVVELIKLPLEEVFLFQQFIVDLSPSLLQNLIKLLGLDWPIVQEIKKSLNKDLPTTLSTNTTTSSSSSTTIPTIASIISTIPSTIPSTSTSTTTTTTTTTSTFTTSTSHSSESPSHSAVNVVEQSLFSHLNVIPVDRPLSILITVQPPSKAVYQRILKPFPTVLLVGSPESIHNLFVEAALIRYDSNHEIIVPAFEGDKLVRVSGNLTATFKKLKILSTSQQQGTLFRMKFTLKRFIDNTFFIVPGAVVFSTTIEVFSHTLYLTEKQLKNTSYFKETGP